VLSQTDTQGIKEMNQTVQVFTKISLDFNGDFKSAIKTGQPLKLEDFLGAKLTARMPLLIATSAVGLGRKCWSSPQQLCYVP